MGRRNYWNRNEISLFIKYTLFLLNFLFWVFGALFIALSSWLLIEKNKVVKNWMEFFLDPVSLICLAGAIVVFVAFFGCMGSLRENTCFIQTYKISLMLVLIGEVALSVLFFVSYSKPELLTELNMSEAFFKKAIMSYREDLDQQNFIDSIQQKLECCGMKDDASNGFKDWNSNAHFNCAINNTSPERCSVPFSCCKRKKDELLNLVCGRNMLDDKIFPDPSKAIHTRGCQNAVREWITQNVLMIGGILLGILIPQLFLIHLASALGSQIKIQRAKLRRNENMLLASYEGSSGSISYVSWPCASDDSNHANSQNIDSFNYLNKSSCITHIDAHTHIFTYTHYASISINLYICLIILKCYQHTSIWVAVYEMDIDCPDVMAGSTHHSMVGHYFFFIFFFLQLPMNLVSGY